MGRRRFQDRPPGTMVWQHAVGAHRPTPREELVKVVKDGVVEYISQEEFDRRRTETIAKRRSMSAKTRANRGATPVRRAIELFHELVKAKPEALPLHIREALAWSELEREVSTAVWTEAREALAEPIEATSPKRVQAAAEVAVEKAAEHASSNGTPAQETLGQRVKNLREGRRWSRVELGRISGISEHAIRVLERDLGSVRGPTVSTMFKISRALGVTLDDLVRGTVGFEE